MKGRWVDRTETLMMLRLTTLTAIAAVSSAAIAAAPSRPLTASEKVVVEHAIRAQLSDPDSAKFRHNGYQAGSTWYCGLVNAKNRLGGFVGYKLFYVIVADGDKATGPIKAVRSSNIVSEDSGLPYMLAESRCSVEGYKTSY
jgi:hypothetical protein